MARNYSDFDNEYIKKYIREMNQYIEEFKDLRKTNPELARKLAREGLQRSGIIDENGKFVYPYNREKDSEDETER